MNLDRDFPYYMGTRSEGKRITKHEESGDFSDLEAPCIDWGRTSIGSLHAAEAILTDALQDTGVTITAAMVQSFADTTLKDKHPLCFYISQADVIKWAENYHRGHLP